MPRRATSPRPSRRAWCPRSLPAIDGWRLSSAYRAAGRANEVGGDFYDVLSFSGGWVAIIGDVVGKGAEAAALTALARHTLAAIAESTADPAYAMQVLNRRLRQRSDDYRSLCTVAVVVVREGEQARSSRPAIRCRCCIAAATRSRSD